jgi:cAMP-binding proteins - catabolite gene activator and regulatory subunit of cAMP-dependent protein kinases
MFKNQILAALSKEEQERLVSRLEPVEMTHGLVLYEIGEQVRHVYFPNSALISLVTEMSDGKIVEVGLIGRDGMSGLTALMSEGTSPERAIVQIPNGGMRVALSVIKDEFMRGGQLQKMLLAYARNFMRQVSQTAACNASHTTEERLSRWLLMCQDRINGTGLKLTQEFIAEMLGTRRATVTLAAMVLQNDGLIQYNRGHIKIIDRPGLEEFTCECYQAIKS